VRNEQPAKSDECGTPGRRFIRGEPAEAAKGGSIVERLSQLHVGRVVPDRQKQIFEHCQGWPGRLVLGSRIEPIKKNCDLISDTSASSDEGARAPCKTKPLLTNRTLRHPLLSSSESP
jgi:hypothetical protein